MVQLSSTGEVGQFLSVTQFDGGSTGKCGFYAIATVAASAPPGNRTPDPTSIASTAHQHYMMQDGQDIPTNQAGMTQAMLQTDLASYGLQGQDITPDWNTIKGSLSKGLPVIICVPEAQVVDKGVGGSPYPWDSTNINHIVLLTGITSDGNVLVRDSANITPPNDIRPGPRIYLISTMTPYWATAVTPAWFAAVHPSQEEPVSIELNTPGVSQFLGPAANGAWRTTAGFHIGGAILSFYKRFGGTALCGLTYLGLPLTEEVKISAQHPEIVLQRFERGILAYDPHHVLDSAPGSGDVYLIHIDGGPGQQLIAAPLLQKLQQQLQGTIEKLTAQVKQFQAQTPVDPAELATLKQQLDATTKLLTDRTARLAQIASDANQIMTIAKV